eukprot:14688653-Alexandrium_andersonii.AAC.1
MITPTIAVRLTPRRSQFGVFACRYRVRRQGQAGRDCGASRPRERGRTVFSSASSPPNIGGS